MNYSNLFYNLHVIIYRFGILLIWGTAIFCLVSLIITSLIAKFSKKEAIFSLSNDKKNKIVKFSLACIPIVIASIFSINPTEAIFKPIYNDSIIQESNVNSEDNVQFNDTNKVTEKENIDNIVVETNFEANTVVDYSDLEIILAIDKSISMATSDNSQIALDTACAIVDLCKNVGNCTLSVVTFGGDEDKEIVVERSNVLTNSDVIKRKIMNIKYTSKFTNIETALDSSADLFSDRDNKKMIILLSDGKIDVNNSIVDEKIRNSLIDKLEKNIYNVPIYTISLKNSLKDEREFDQELMEEIAIKTGATNEVIDTAKGLNSLSDDGNNLYEFFAKILQKHLGSKITFSNGTVTIDSNNPYSINSEIIKNSANVSLFVYGDCSKIDIQTDTGEICKGKNYIVINLNNSNKTSNKYVITSTEEVNFRYVFIYNFDISIGYSMSDVLNVGEPISIKAKLISNTKIKEDTVNAYLQVFTEDVHLSEEEPIPSNTISLHNNSAIYLLSDEYVFESPGTYYCRIVLEDKNKKFIRASDYNKIIVNEPKIKILSATNKEKNKLNVVAELILNSNENDIYTTSEIIDNYELSLSLDGINYEISKLEKLTFKTDLYSETILDNHDLFCRLKVKDNINKLCKSKTNLTEGKLKINKLENAAPYLTNGNSEEIIHGFKFFSDNKCVVNLNDYFGDDSSVFDIKYETQSQGTECKILDNNGNKSLEITSNIFGLNRVKIQAVDKKDSALISDPLIIAFNIKFYLGEVSISIFSYILILLITFFVARRFKYGIIKLRIEIGNYGNYIYAIFKGKSMKVRKLLGENENSRAFRRIKIKRISSNTTSIRIIHSPNINRNSIFYLDEVDIYGMNNQKITIRREE